MSSEMRLLKSPAKACILLAADVAAATVALGRHNACPYMHACSLRPKVRQQPAKSED
jgi:hypothetical protein